MASDSARSIRSGSRMTSQVASICLRPCPRDPRPSVRRQCRLLREVAPAASVRSIWPSISALPASRALPPSSICPPRDRAKAASAHRSSEEDKTSAQSIFPPIERSSLLPSARSIFRAFPTRAPLLLRVHLRRLRPVFLHRLAVQLVFLRCRKRTSVSLAHMSPDPACRVSRTSPDCPRYPRGCHPPG